MMDYNLLFRWFVGLSMDAPIWDVTVFTKNRERLLAGDIAAKFLAALLSQPRVKALVSDEHFSVGGTLIEAWTSMKSFKPSRPDCAYRRACVSSYLPPYTPELQPAETLWVMSMNPSQTTTSTPSPISTAPSLSSAANWKKTPTASKDNAVSIGGQNQKSRIDQPEPYKSAHP
jgi:hypothetical protein